MIFCHFHHIFTHFHQNYSKFIKITPNLSKIHTFYTKITQNSSKFTQNSLRKHILHEIFSENTALVALAQWLSPFLCPLTLRVREHRASTPCSALKRRTPLASLASHCCKELRVNYSSRVNSHHCGTENTCLLLIK